MSGNSGGNLDRRVSATVRMGADKRRRSTPRAVTAFTRQLASLLGAGLALVQALDLIARSERRDAMPYVARALARRISNGERFAVALTAYPAQFDRLYLELCAIGEATGSLSLVLARIVEHRERASALRGKLRSALAYPCAVVLLAGAVTAALLTFVVPTFSHVFDSYGTALPGPTRAVIALSEFVTYWGPLVLAASASLLLVVIHLVRRSPRARTARDRALLSIPLAGPLLRATAAARWSRSLGTLLAAGIPLSDALRALSRVTGNAVFDAASAQIEARLRRGERLAQAMRRVACFPSAFVETIAVAEESGALDAMLLDCAALAEREIDEALALASACAEPFIVIVLGLAVGALVVALYLPVIELGNVV